MTSLKKKLHATHRKMRKEKNESRENNLADLSPYILVITLNLNCLNIPKKPEIQKVDKESQLNCMLYV